MAAFPRPDLRRRRATQPARGRHDARVDPAGHASWSSRPEERQTNSVPEVKVVGRMAEARVRPPASLGIVRNGARYSGSGCKLILVCCTLPPVRATVDHCDASLSLGPRTDGTVHDFALHAFALDRIIEVG